MWSCSTTYFDFYVQISKYNLLLSYFDAFFSLKLKMFIRPEQFNFLFFEPAELRFSKIGEKNKINPSLGKRKIKKGLGIFPFKRFFFFGLI